jgi:thioredoxin 1
MRLLFLLSIVSLFLLLPGLSSGADLPSATDANIRAAAGSGRPTVVDFGARACIPCKKMAPILAELESELKGKGNVLFVDVREARALAHQYRVQMIPTQIFYDVKGKEVKRHMGFMDKADIVKELKVAGLK